MSQGRYRMMWTILADIAGLALSFFYGMYIPVWIGQLLPEQLNMLPQIVSWLYTLLLMPLTHWPTLHAAFQNPGLTWLVIAILFRVCYLLHYLQRRAKADDLTRPYVGEPGDQYYEIFKHRLKEYNGAIQRWKPTFALRIPTWCYYTRVQSDQPDLFWRGRTLVIEKSLFTVDRRQELRAYLARELMYYTCEDVAFRDILEYYPKKPSFLLNVTGLCIFWPVTFSNRLLWPTYWKERLLIADDFAYGLGQGYALYALLEAQATQDDALSQERGQLAREIARLEVQLGIFQKKASIKDWTLPHDDQQSTSSRNARNAVTENAETRFRLRWNQNILYIEELKHRDKELEAQEQRARKIRPLLDERIGQLRARVGTEQRWKAKHGIKPSASPGSLPTQQTPRQFPPDRRNG